MHRKRNLVKLSFIVGFVMSAFSFGSCIWEEIPYEDENGVAKFPFFNACNKSFTVSLCVKGTSPGSDRIVFNRFSAVAGAHSLVTLSGGNWKDFQNYRWIVGEDIECPFEH